jgi:hypothetical protein
MATIEELTARGEVSPEAKTITYLREYASVGGDLQSDLAFEKTTVPLRPAAVVLPATAELLDDTPAFEAYVNQRGDELFRRSLGGLIVTAIEEAGPRCVRPKIFETNRRAIGRAVREVRKDSDFKLEVVPIDRKKTVIGAFAEGLTLWTQGEVKAEATSAYSDYIRDLIAIRLEQPVAVTVYRPEAFAVVQTRGWERLRRLWDKVRYGSRSSEVA